MIADFRRRFEDGCAPAKKLERALAYYRAAWELTASRRGERPGRGCYGFAWDVCGDYLCRIVGDRFAQDRARAEGRPTAMGDGERCTRLVMDLLLWVDHEEGDDDWKPQGKCTAPRG